MEEHYPSMDDEFIKLRQSSFNMLFDLLCACSVIIEFFPKINYEFPPHWDDVNKVMDEFGRIAKDKKLKITQTLPEGDKEFGDIMIAFLYGNKTEILSVLNNLDIRKPFAARTLARICFLLTLPWELPEDEWSNTFLPDPERRTEFAIRDIELIRFVANARANEFLGYWTAKMEEKKRNLKSAKSKTKKLQRKKETLRELLKAQKTVDRDLIIRAMRVTDLGERRVKDLIKEITIKKEN